MKKHELFEALSDLDPRLVQEAYVRGGRRRTSKKRIAASIMSAAACLCLIAVGVATRSVWLPQPDQSASPYDSDSAVMERPDSGSSATARPDEATPPSDEIITVDGFQIRNGASISYCGSGTEVTVPVQVRTLSAGTFDRSENAAEIESLTLESEDTKLDAGVLRVLSALREVHVKNGVTRCEDLTAFMKMSAEEIVNSGFSLEYSHARHGGEPVYRVAELENVYLDFSFRNVTVEGDARSALSSDASPYLVEIRTEWEKDANGVSIVTPRPELKTENGIYCGMSGEALAEADDSYVYEGINVTEGGELILSYQKDSYRILCFLTDYSDDFGAFEEYPEADTEWIVQEVLGNRRPDGIVARMELWLQH